MFTDGEVVLPVQRRAFGPGEIPVAEKIGVLLVDIIPRLADQQGAVPVFGKTCANVERADTVAKIL